MGELDYVQGAFIEVAREQIARRFLHECSEPYLLFIDSDHSFQREDAEKLIDAMEWYPKLGLCGGLTVFRDGRYKPVVQWFEDDPDTPEEKLFKRITRYMKEGCVKNVDYVGTGFTIIRRKVFEDLEEPFFRVYHDGKKNFWGEDVHFLKAVKEAGWKAAVHFGTNVGHIGIVDYKPRELLELAKVLED